jgi:hypothetical protein
MTVPTKARAPRFVGKTKIEWHEREVPQPGEDSCC